MRVLVTGGSGMLGRVVVDRVRRDGDEAIAAARFASGPPDDPSGSVHMDVADAESVRRTIRQTQPDTIIHAAAIADVDLCEREPQLAHAVNVRGTQHIVDACRESGARLVYVSTDYVFDGGGAPYDEGDEPNPIQVYGRTKLEGERAVASLPGALSARTAVLFGRAPAWRSNLVLWLLDRLERREPAVAATDQVGTPTLVDNLADMLIALARSDRDGIYHAAGATNVDRYTFARQTAEVFGYDPDRVQPIRAAESSRPARRPPNVGLNVERLRRDFPTVLPLSTEQALLQLRAQLHAEPTTAVRA
jgi:dTDP-4-dehydrorhamnose reductase